MTQKILSQFKEPSDEYMQIAKKIIDSFLEIFGSESKYLESEGAIVSQDETERVFNEYLEKLDLVEHLTLNFSRKQIAPTSVTHDPKTGKSKINIRLPCEYRQDRIIGVLDHEIGTHFLRRYNEKF